MSLNYSFTPRDPATPKSLTYHDTDAFVRTVCFAQADGETLFLNYAYLISAGYTPADGSITLVFTTHIVTLKGVNLQAACDRLAAHAVRQVAAIEERYALLGGEDPFVTQILVQQL